MTSSGKYVIDGPHPMTEEQAQRRREFFGESGVEAKVVDGVASVPVDLNTGKVYFDLRIHHRLVGFLMKVDEASQFQMNRGRGWVRTFAKVTRAVANMNHNGASRNRRKFRKWRNVVFQYADYLDGYGPTYAEKQNEHKLMGHWWL